MIRFDDATISDDHRSTMTGLFVFVVFVGFVVIVVIGGDGSGDGGGGWWLVVVGCDSSGSLILHSCFGMTMTRQSFNVDLWYSQLVRYVVRVLDTARL